LENEGYEVQPFIIPACAKNAPHRRDRVWFVAYSKDSGYRGWLCERCPNGERELLSDKQRRSEMGCEIEGCCRIENATNTESIRIQGQCNNEKQSSERGEYAFNDFSNASASSNWIHFPTQSPICGGDDGLPTELDGITFPKWRAESIKGYGNAIVPQIAYQIFKTIKLENERFFY
jgi:DNA (cytosine-5)-methyltransferase 1